VPFAVIAGNQDALGNVSASIAYTNRSLRWRHPDYAFRVTTAGAFLHTSGANSFTSRGAVERFPHALPGNTTLDGTHVVLGTFIVESVASPYFHPPSQFS
jgi:hypothetical protein